MATGAGSLRTQASVSDLLASVSTHNKDGDRAPASLLLFGNGDGGGGPTEAMCEQLARLGDPQGAAGHYPAVCSVYRAVAGCVCVCVCVRACVCVCACACVCVRARARLACA